MNEIIDNSGEPEGPNFATHTEDGEEIAVLWDKLKSGDAEARNKLTEVYYDIIRANSENIAKILIEAIEEQDIFQAGVVAFFEALNDYDPAKHGPFEQYSSVKIRHSILEEIKGLVGEE
ncbi:MAG: sigma-70 family RNA polymerase sigma factor [Planctomycetota bacterium]